MSAPSLDSESSQSSSGYEDGLGRRVLAFDRETGAMLERLVLRPELAAFEAALRERLTIVAGLEDERFTRPRAIERGADDRVTVVSDTAAGRRLADVLDAAAEHGIIAGLDAGLGLLLELLPALARLHDAGLAHGALAPGRLLVTAGAQVVLLDSIYAEPLERLKLSRHRLWSEFRLAFAASAGGARFDKAADLGHAAMIAAALSVGRPLRDDDYPDGIPALRQEILEIASIRGSKTFADAVDSFFASTLPLAGRRAKAAGSADEAASDLRKLVRKELGINTCRTALLEFLQQVEAADAERMVSDAALGQRALAEADAARLEAERLEADRSAREHAEAEARERKHSRERAEKAERIERERAEQARLEAERAARGEAERLAREQADAERREQEDARERAEQARQEAERLEQERAEEARLEAERLERERAEKARLEAERVARERAEQARLELERLEAERLEAERLERERVEKARIEAERLEKERAEKARREAERLEKERLEKERAEKARLEAERLEKERAEKARLEAERLEKERLEKERAEKARLEAERLEKERLEKERAEKARLEKERLEKERAEKARLEAERLEKERVERERAEKARLEKERLEKERAEKARLEKERIEKERAEKARIEAERLEKARLEKERLEKERAEKARVEAERLERERVENERRERVARERAEKARVELERAEKARVEAERLEKERAEAERRERELLEAARAERDRAEKARLEAVRLEQERVEHARLEAEREEQEELRERAERARIEAERVAAEQRELERERAQELAREQARQRELEQERQRAEAPPERREPAPAPPAAGNSWLIPPDRAAKFEPVIPDVPPPASTPRAYPIYVPPAEPASWTLDVQPSASSMPELEPVASSAPSFSLSPSSTPGGTIRLKDSPTDEFSSSWGRGESRQEPDSMSAEGAYEPFGTNETTRTVPWKLIGAGVVLIGATLAITWGYTPASAPLMKTVRNVAPAVVPAPAPPASSGPEGHLAITTQPAGARVTLDGKAVGETPLTLDTVSPGRHVITVTAPSGASAKRTVRVEAGKTVNIDLPLFSGFAAISAPFVIEVSENGKAVGTSSDQILLTPGRHDLRLANKELGYLASETVEIQAGEVTRLSVDPRGRANINAAPWAEVWIDGEKAGETPLANVAIRLGIREIVFKNPQFGERKVTATITAKAPATISVDFNK